MLYSICVLVTIPDEAVAPNTIHHDIPSEVVEGARTMLDRMEALRKAPMPTDEVVPEQSDVPRGQKKERLMIITVTYQNGRIVLPPDIELVKDTFAAILHVPDEAVRLKRNGAEADEGFSVRREIEVITGMRDSRET